MSLAFPLAMQEVDWHAVCNKQTPLLLITNILLLLPCILLVYIVHGIDFAVLYYDIMNSYLTEFESATVKVLSVLEYVFVIMYTFWAK